MSVSVEQVARGCSGAYQEVLTRECRTSTRAGITNESIRGSRSGLVIFLTECLKQCSQSLEGSALPHIQLVKLVDVDSSFIKHMVSAHLYIPVLEQTHFNVQLRLAIVLLAAYSRLYSNSIRTWSRRICLKRAARGLATSWPCIVVWTPRQVSWYVPWHFIAPPQRISQNLIPNRSPIVLAFRDISWHIEP